MIELLYILTSDWVLRTPNAGQNMLLNIFNAEKLKFDAKFGKKNSFLSLHQNTGPRKIMFSLLKHIFTCKKLLNTSFAVPTQCFYTSF